MNRSNQLCITGLLLVLFSLSAIGQEKAWRPVSPDELQSKTPVVEPDADVEAIFWEVRIDDSKDDLAMTHYVRLKIFTDRGRERYSKVDVPYSKDMKIKDLAARVTKVDGTTVEIGKDDIFEREIVKAGGQKIKARSFAVPNLEQGAIIEYRYREIINDATASGMRLPFQRDIPIRNLAYYYKPAGKLPPDYRPYNFTDTEFVKDTDGFWVAKRSDIPAFKDEPRMPPEDNVRAWMRLSHVNVFSFQGTVSTLTVFFSESKDPAQYWESFGKSRSGWVLWMNKDNHEITKTAQEITNGVTTPDEKLRKIYEFCQKEINNTWYDTTLTEEQKAKPPKIDSVQDVLKERSAAGPYINYLFGALAHAAGFETAILFTGDKRKMLFVPEYTDRTLLMPAGAAVKIKNEWQFFDPGTKFLPYGMLHWYEEGGWAVVVGEERFAMTHTPMTDYAGSAVNRSAKLTLSEDGSIEGDVTMELTGQLALSYRLENYDETQAKQEQDLVEEVKHRLSAAEVTNVSVENLSDSTKPLVEKYHVKVPGYAQRTGKRLFVQPGYFKYGVEPEFTSSTRKYDIFFRHPWSENDQVEIHWPSGFDLDNADAPADVADPKKIGEIKIKIAADRAHDILTYSRNFHFGGSGAILFTPQMYTPLKNLFDAFHTVDSHTITLKQK